MNTVSADSRTSWSVSLDDRVAASEIALLKRTYVLPWNPGADAGRSLSKQRRSVYS